MCFVSIANVQVPAPHTESCRREGNHSSPDSAKDDSVSAEQEEHQAAAQPSRKRAASDEDPNAGMFEHHAGGKKAHTGPTAKKPAARQRGRRVATQPPLRRRASGAAAAAAAPRRSRDDDEPESPSGLADMDVPGSPRGDKDIKDHVTNLHKQAANFPPVMGQDPFKIDVRKLSDPTGMLKIRDFDPARIAHLSQEFSAGSLTTAKVVFDDMQQGLLWDSFTDKKHKALQVNLLDFVRERFIAFVDIMRTLHLTAYVSVSQTFLSDSSMEEIIAKLGNPILAGGYHSSKALITHCNTPSPDTKEGKLIEYVPYCLGWGCLCEVGGNACIDCDRLTLPAFAHNLLSTCRWTILGR